MHANIDTYTHKRKFVAYVIDIVYYVYGVVYYVYGVRIVWGPHMFL